MKKVFGKSRGQMIVLVAAGLAIFIAMVGVVVDVGSLYVARRQMQTAADAAAVAGANALHGSSIVSAGYATAAADAAGNNGFTSTNSTITATEVPCPGAASQQCVQANVSQAVPVYFLRALGYTTMNVATTAVAGGVNSPACVFALDPTAGKALTVNGSANITSACGIIVDSNDSEALYGGSSSLSVTASAIGVQGGYTASSGWSPTPQTGIAPAPDPLANFVEPPVPTTCDYNLGNISKDTALTQGTYCGGLKITGGNITFGPGLYTLMGNGMKATGTTTALSGTGVTFFNTGGTIGNTPYHYGAISLGSNGTVTLVAPTSGPYEGMLFLQDRNISPGGNSPDASNIVGGGSNSVFDGILYFPNTSLTYSGSSNTVGSCTATNAGYTSLIADTVTLTGGAGSDICADFSTMGGKNPLSSNTFYE
jgi:Flp pilus assembly protein TadG